MSKSIKNNYNISELLENIVCEYTIDYQTFKYSPEEINFIVYKIKKSKTFDEEIEEEYKNCENTITIYHKPIGYFVRIQINNDYRSYFDFIKKIKYISLNYSCDYYGKLKEEEEIITCGKTLFVSDGKNDREITIKGIDINGNGFVKSIDKTKNTEIEIKNYYYVLFQTAISQFSSMMQLTTLLDTLYLKDKMTVSVYKFYNENSKNLMQYEEFKNEFCDVVTKICQFIENNEIKHEYEILDSKNIRYRDIFV